MNEIDISTSVCRFCRFYQPEGRRGGSCQKLDVLVQSNWQACSLASSPFETTLTKLENIFQLQTAIPSNSAAEIATKRIKLDSNSDLSAMVSPKLE
ncbi:MAG: hypothetical protein AAFQ41_15285 [Cyanobacteria bacterium J06623_7]